MFRAHVTLILLATLTLWSQHPLNAQEQNNNTGTRTQEKNDETAIVDEEIKELHERVGKAIKEVYGDVEKKRIPIGRGLSNRMGQRNRKVYLEEVEFAMSGGALSKVEMYYTETGTKSLLTETRKIVYDGSGNINEIAVVWETGPKTRSYKIKDLLSMEKRYKVKLLYRSYLNRFLRSMEVEVQRRKAEENAEVDHILRLGQENK